MTPPLNPGTSPGLFYVHGGWWRGHVEDMAFFFSKGSTWTEVGSVPVHFTGQQDKPPFHLGAGIDRAGYLFAVIAFRAAKRQGLGG